MNAFLSTKYNILEFFTYISTLASTVTLFLEVKSEILDLGLTTFPLF